MTVTKRDGSLAELNIEKIHQSLEQASDGINNVSVSEVELQANLQLVDKIKTSDIHKVLTKTTADLISVRYPNYQYMAARLLLMENRKEVFGSYDPKPLLDMVKQNISLGYYENILEYFTEEEIQFYDSKINHNRDLEFTYAGLRTVFDKYAVKDKKTERIFETPQIIFMLVAMIGLKNQKHLIVDFYHSLSTFKISLPSPIMSGLRTPTKGYASCCLIDLGDTKESLTAANSASVIMTAVKAGIGLHGGSVRGINAPVSNGTIEHTGVVPILKWFEGAVKAFSQGARGGGATIYFPFWNYEITKILTLKSNKSTDENSVRKLDYGIGFNQLIFDRAKDDLDVTLFSAEDTRELDTNLGDYNLWLQSYLKYEKSHIRKTKIKARVLLKSFATEAFETGRYYPLFLDNVNKGPLSRPIKMSNLCGEIYLNTTPLEHLYDPKGEIALCILSNINASKVKLDEMPKMAKLLVHFLNNIIDIQEYPLPAAENSTKDNRYLGIGVSDWAQKLSKDKLQYYTNEALDVTEEYFETWQFCLLTASMELSKLDGEAPKFRENSEYASGYLPNKDKQRFISKKKWLKLSKDIIKYGLRNLTLSAVPPAATSSDLSNSTSGIDFPRDFLISKKSKSGPVKQIVPNFAKGSSFYTLAFEEAFDNKQYLHMVSKMQLYVDQGISTNTYWSEKDFVDDKMSMGKLIQILRYAHKIGLKGLYYTNFDDQSIAKNSNGESTPEECEGGGCSV